MAQQCTAAFDEIAGPLGHFSCRHAPALVHLRNPLHLTNLTLPVVEFMMVTGAVLALVHAIRRLRRHGDPTNLALWFATVVYLFVIEVPLYFPNVFGIEDQLGIVFVHNVFTVDFLFDRLPLYIVALYPAVVSVAYEIVRGLGVFRDRGIIVGAVCVGFVHHCFYEIFDQLGPQLHWWAWNTANPINHPMLTAVPMTSVFIFATLGPIVVTVLVLRLVQGPHRVGRTVLAGALVPVGIAVLSIPTSLFGGPHPHTAVQAALFTVELAAVAVVALPALIGQSRNVTPEPSGLVRVFGPLYLVVLAALWITALPPTGNLPYAAGCLALAVWAVSLQRPRSHDPGDTARSAADRHRSKTGPDQTNSSASRSR
ncbi:hypothetical protein PT015_11665 [Candidatus Mycobacterium wuenschmannii]|uniref:Integral membrane protein n=1 Tax=Candidatus Mycobacterium wuenschmannii TaxID=3027808 RepID=A0ABY8W2Q7_9MYCO|nr:hypothetical protein [Candidatus Mycobacterium wuenschmannii]WIM90017.1 hypothetical protein PT015_11665 [Candidatus Mycobacterium wuenschmannii]